MDPFRRRLAAVRAAAAILADARRRDDPAMARLAVAYVAAQEARLLADEAELLARERPSDDAEEAWGRARDAAAEAEAGLERLLSLAAVAVG